MKQKILLIDDELEKCESLAVTLSDAGYVVDVATTIESALKKIRKNDKFNQYQFILVDLYLPSKEDGLNAVKWLKDEKKEFKIFILTMYGDGQSTREARKAGADSYIFFTPGKTEDIIDVLEASNAVEELIKELANRKSRSKLKELINQAGIGVSIIDRTFRILYMNQKQRDLSRDGCEIGGICWVEYNGRNDNKPCKWCPCVLAMKDGETHTERTISFIGDSLHYFRVVACPIFASTAFIVPDDLQKVEDIVNKLHDKSNTFIKYLNKYYSKDLNNIFSSNNDLSNLTQLLVDFFNKIIKGNLIGEPKIINNITLRKETKVLINLSPRGADLRHLNRIILVEIFAGLIEKRKIIGAIEFVRDITDQQRAENDLIEAREVNKRLYSILEYIHALGFKRARVYELSEDKDRTILRGRIAYGETIEPIQNKTIMVNDDDSSKETLQNYDVKMYRKDDNKIYAEIDDIWQYKEVIEWFEVPIKHGNNYYGKIIIDNLSNDIPYIKKEGEIEKLESQHNEQLLKYAAFIGNEIFMEKEQRRVDYEILLYKTLRDLQVKIANTNTTVDEAFKMIVDTALIFLNSESYSPISNRDVKKNVDKSKYVPGAHLRIFEGGQLVMKAGSGPYYESAKKSRKVINLDINSGSTVAWVNDETYIQQDTRDDKSFNDYIEYIKDDNIIKKLKQIKSYACFIIRVDNVKKGVLNFQSNEFGFFGPTVQKAAEDFIAMLSPIIRYANMIEEVTLAKERLLNAAGMAAHRINNPNFAIQGLSSFWLDKMRNSNDNNNLAKSLESMSNASSSIANIVSDLRRFLNAQTSEIEVKQISINLLLESIIIGYRAAYPQVIFSLQLIEKEPDIIANDKLFEEIIGELITNACRSMQDKGKISIISEIAECDELVEIGLNYGNFFKVSIIDNGKGISLDKKEKIFEPFFTEYSKGTGLGLPFIRDTLKKMNAYIREVGTPNNGARFNIYFPIINKGEK